MNLERPLYYKGIYMSYTNGWYAISADVGYKEMLETVDNQRDLVVTVFQILGYQGEVPAKFLIDRDLKTLMDEIFEYVKKYKPKLLKKFFKYCNTSNTNTVKYTASSYLISRKTKSRCEYRLEDKVTHYEMNLKIFHSKGVFLYSFKTEYMYGDKNTVIFTLLENLKRLYKLDSSTGILVTDGGYYIAIYRDEVLKSGRRNYFTEISAAFKAILAQIIEDRVW